MLTGKDIFEAWKKADPTRDLAPWDDHTKSFHGLYNAVAERLNVQLVKAEEEANRTVYSAADILLILPHIIKGMKKISEHPEQEYAEEMATSYLTDVLDLLTDILPDDIRPLVRQILRLYQQITTEVP